MSRITIGIALSVAKKGQKVSVRLPDGKIVRLIAESDIITREVLVIGDRVLSKDIAQVKLTQTTQFFQSKSNWEERKECKLIASSLLRSQSSFSYNPEHPYNYTAWQIESLIPESQPFTSWRYDSVNRYCEAVQDGSGTYESFQSCLASNSQGAVIRRISSSGEGQPYSPLYFYDPSESYVATIVIQNNEADGGRWAYESEVYRVAPDFGGTQKLPPTYKYPGQSYKFRLSLGLPSSFAGTDKFYEATYRDGRGNTAAISYNFAEYRINGSIGTMDFGTQQIRAIVSETDVAYDSASGNGTFDHRDLQGLSLPPSHYQFVDINGGKGMSIADRDKFQEIYPPPFLPSDPPNVTRDPNYTDYTLIDRKQFLLYRYELLSDIDYVHIVNSGYTNYFVKVHDPDFPLLNAVKIPRGRLHRIFFIFLGDRAFIFVKIGKVTNPSVPFDQRPWYQIKVIELRVTKDLNLTALEEVLSDSGDRLVKTQELDFVYPELIKINGVDLKDMSDIVIRNKLGYLDEPVLEESKCFDAEKYYHDSYFLETNFKNAEGVIIEYKLPGRRFGGSI